MKLEPVIRQDAVIILAVADTAPHPAGLQSAIDPIRIAAVYRDRIELRDIEIVEKKKALPAIVRYRRSFIIADVETIAVGRIDPQRVEIAFDALQLSRKSAPAVFRDMCIIIQYINAIRIVGIDPHMGIVKRPVVAAIYISPRCPAIFRTVDAAAQPAHIQVFGIRLPADLLGRMIAVFNLRNQDTRIGPINRQSYFADVSGGQPVGELAPALSAVSRLKNATIWTATNETVRHADALPHSDV